MVEGWTHKKENADACLSFAIEQMKLDYPAAVEKKSS